MVSWQPSYLRYQIHVMGARMYEIGEAVHGIGELESVSVACLVLPYVRYRSSGFPVGSGPLLPIVHYQPEDSYYMDGKEIVGPENQNIPNISAQRRFSLPYLC